MSTGIRNTVIVLVYTGLESSCKDWKLVVFAYGNVERAGLESSCKDWKQMPAAEEAQHTARLESSCKDWKQNMTSAASNSCDA